MPWLLLQPPSAAWADNPNLGELVDRTALRVCADPNALPFSNEQGQGFENKIAEAMAQKLGVPLTYTWFPQTVGFVRNTLRANRCDLIMGVVAADELVQNTNPYYRSSYVLVHREGEGDRFGSLDGPAMRTARIGVVAGTPVVDLLVRKGLIAQARSYQLVVDTRLENPPKAMIEDLARGEIDAALIWGPIAGYHAEREARPLTLVPLTGDPRTGPRLDFRISMGIRPDEPAWKHQVNDLIRELQPQIQAILLDHGVPLLDEQGRPIGADQPPAVTAVPEPQGYRMEKYRAPVPATLAGATVLTTEALRRLIAERHPILVDVLPKPRKPKDRPVDRVWVEPPAREHPGLGLAAQHRLRRAVVRVRRLLPRPARAADRRRQGKAARVLLRRQLLDVLERRQAGDAGARLHQRLLVPRRRAGLEERRPAGGRGARGADAGFRAAVGSAHVEHERSRDLTRRWSGDRLA